MRCPKCQGSMTTKHFGAQITLERCEHCFGIWFTAENLGDLDKLPMIDVLDEGDPKVGAVFNRITNINCPTCGTLMTNNSVPKQPHISVETCATCTGVFLDAGELHDAKLHTFGDWMKSIREILPGL